MTSVAVRCSLVASVTHLREGAGSAGGGGECVCVKEGKRGVSTTRTREGEEGAGWEDVERSSRC